MASQFLPGTVVKITGLRGNVELNGMLGVVKRFVDDVDGRFAILVPGHRNTFAIKPCNLIPVKIPTNKRRYQHAVFWPKVKGVIPMHAFDDWPSDWTDEKNFLRQTLKWTKPMLLSGIEREHVAKPDFQMYFDANDQVSRVNDVAASIEALLPAYERSKVSKSGPIRGACVLVYSPMKSTTFAGGGGSPQFMASMPPQGVQTTSGNPNRQFSLAQLGAVLQFQQSEQGRAQYKAHDNPMHRMFGV